MPSRPIRQAARKAAGPCSPSRCSTWRIAAGGLSSFAARRSLRARLLDAGPVELLSRRVGAEPGQVILEQRTKKHSKPAAARRAATHPSDPPQSEPHDLGSPPSQGLGCQAERREPARSPFLSIFISAVRPLTRWHGGRQGTPGRSPGRTAPAGSAPLPDGLLSIRSIFFRERPRPPV
jgi:hypothetical protein